MKPESGGGLLLLRRITPLTRHHTVYFCSGAYTKAIHSAGAVYNNVAVGKTFKVQGATFTLQLPDGRLAIVNCEGKFAEHMAGAAGNRRSCRMPLVDSIQVDFKGDNAKLIWPVSIDGKKMQSETYKILGVLDKPKAPYQ
jgi:hypothetical protein